MYTLPFAPPLHAPTNQAANLGRFLNETLKLLAHWKSSACQCQPRAPKSLFRKKRVRGSVCRHREVKCSPTSAPRAKTCPVCFVCYETASGLKDAVPASAPTTVTATQTFYNSAQASRSTKRSARRCPVKHPYQETPPRKPLLQTTTRFLQTPGEQVYKEECAKLPGFSISFTKVDPKKATYDDLVKARRI